jgi:hypothetical protein
MTGGTGRTGQANWDWENTTGKAGQAEENTQNAIIPKCIQSTVQLDLSRVLREHLEI